MTDYIKEFEMVRDLLKEAKEHKLDPEVVFFALKYMKDYPDRSISEAMAHGYYEWVK